MVSCPFSGLHRHQGSHTSKRIILATSEHTPLDQPLHGRASRRWVMAMVPVWMARTPPLPLLLPMFASCWPGPVMAALWECDPRRPQWQLLWETGVSGYFHWHFRACFPGSASGLWAVQWPLSQQKWTETSITSLCSKDVMPDSDDLWSEMMVVVNGNRMFLSISVKYAVQASLIPTLSHTGKLLGCVAGTKKSIFDAGDS